MSTPPVESRDRSTDAVPPPESPRAQDIRTENTNKTPKEGVRVKNQIAEGNSNKCTIPAPPKGGAAQGEVVTDHSPPLSRRYQPFPTVLLPEPVRGFVEAGAKAIGCDEALLALPLLTMLGAAIGTTRQLMLKSGWRVWPILWTAVVGESGTSKTPAFRLAMKTVRDHQAKALQDNLKAHQELAAKHKNDPPPSEPPSAPRFVVGDVTVEALIPLLQENPRGLLMARDELNGWFGSFNQYSAGKGSDASYWLSMYGGESLVVDRKTGTPRTISVPQAAVWITGGIQPGILDRAFGKEHRESGLAARLLLAYPPRRAKRWTEADITPETEQAITRLIERLFTLEPIGNEEGDHEPVVVSLAPEAKVVWQTFYDAHNKELVELSGDLAAAWSKLEECPARLGLIIHLVRWAAGDSTLAPHELDKESMAAAIELTEWFKAETQRVYAVLGESEKDRSQRRLIEWIDDKGGAVTVREVQRGLRAYSTSTESEAALTDLSRAGHGHWQVRPPGLTGGPPSRMFRLGKPSTVDTTPTNPEERRSSVSVDRPDS